MPFQKVKNSGRSKNKEQITESQNFKLPVMLQRIRMTSKLFGL